VAQQAVATASVAQTGASTTAETLTFSGLLFAGRTKQITLNASNTLDDTIAQINADASLNRDIVASKSADGKLILSSRQYGAGYSFTVQSDQAAGANNSGIGTTAISAQGADVAGTINGEAAAGTGQYLIGSSTSPNTAGLSLRVTATTTGDHGTVSITKGIAATLSDLIENMTDLSSGALTTAQNGVQSQIDDIQKSITDMESLLQSQEERMRDQFLRMESALSRLQSQSQWLSSQIAQMGSFVSAKTK